MIQANRIRQFVRDHYIAPARAAGHAEITIRAGDVHREMSLTNAMPAVCSAIGSSKFDEFAGVTRTALTGPANGANVYFTFDLRARPLSDRTMFQRREPVRRPVQSPPRKKSRLSQWRGRPRFLRQEQTVTFCPCTRTVHVSLVPKSTGHRRGEWCTLVCSLLTLRACSPRC